jgi:hypothetical protein
LLLIVGFFFLVSFSKARITDGELFDFPSLLWTFPLSSEDTMVKVMLLNRSDDVVNIQSKAGNGEVIATLAFKAKQLQDSKTTTVVNHQDRLSTFSMLSYKKGSKGAVYGGKLLFQYNVSSLSAFQSDTPRRTSHISDILLPPLLNISNSRQMALQHSGREMSFGLKELGVKTVSESSLLSYPSLKTPYDNRLDDSAQWNIGITSDMMRDKNNSSLFSSSPSEISPVHLDPSFLISQPIFKIGLQVIAAIDLPSIHRFKANSPVCSVACGKFSYTTKVSDNTGSFANWDNLGGKDKSSGGKGKRGKGLFITVDQHSQLRFLVSSLSETIGQCSLSRKKLCEGTKTEDNSYVVCFSYPSPSLAEFSDIFLIVDL